MPQVMVALAVMHNLANISALYAYYSASLVLQARTVQH